MRGPCAGGDEGTKLAAEAVGTAVSIVFGALVDGGSLCPDAAWTTFWRTGEVGRQATPLVTCFGVEAADLGEVALAAAATHRA